MQQKMWQRQARRPKCVLCTGKSWFRECYPCYRGHWMWWNAGGGDEGETSTLLLLLQRGTIWFQLYFEWQGCVSVPMQTGWASIHFKTNPRGQMQQRFPCLREYARCMLYSMPGQAGLFIEDTSLEGEGLSIECKERRREGGTIARALRMPSHMLVRPLGWSCISVLIACRFPAARSSSQVEWAQCSGRWR